MKFTVMNSYPLWRFQDAIKGYQDMKLRTYSSIKADQDMIY